MARYTFAKLTGNQRLSSDFMKTWKKGLDVPRRPIKNLNPYRNKHAITDFINYFPSVILPFFRNVFKLTNFTDHSFHVIHLSPKTNNLTNKTQFKHTYFTYFTNLSYLSLTPSTDIGKSSPLKTLPHGHIKRHQLPSTTYDRDTCAQMLQMLQLSILKNHPCYAFIITTTDNNYLDLISSILNLDTPPNNLTLIIFVYIINTNGSN